MRLLQKMGWRSGQGVGPRLTHRQWKREQMLRRRRKGNAALLLSWNVDLVARGAIVVLQLLWHSCIVITGIDYLYNVIGRA